MIKMGLQASYRDAIAFLTKIRNWKYWENALPLSLFFSYFIYSFTNGITPGPANICSLSASIRYGRKPALVQWRGLVTGFVIVACISAIATWIIGAALVDYVGYLSWIGAAYILWLAWHIFRSDANSDQDDPSYPTFASGILVQLTNAKIIISCTAALAGFILPVTQSFPVLLAASLFFAAVGLLSNLAWLYTGDKLKNVFSQHQKLVNTIMALSLVVCAATMVIPS